MTLRQQSNAEDGSLGRDLLYALRYYLGSRRGFLILAAIVIGGGLAFNWTWLVAAGIAPLLLSVLPCVAMCALGLCMKGAGGKSCSSKPVAEKVPDISGNGEMLLNEPENNSSPKK